MTSCPQIEAATNSASAELRVVHDCRLDFQVIGPPLRDKMKPDTERLVSGSAAKSESTHPPK